MASPHTGRSISISGRAHSSLRLHSLTFAGAEVSSASHITYRRRRVMSDMPESPTRRAPQFRGSTVVAEPRLARAASATRACRTCVRRYVM